MASTDVWIQILSMICIMVAPNWSLEQEETEDFYEETVVLKTKTGSLRGRKEVVDFKTSYYSFKGIKYAKAPIGERRFQPPEAEEPWSGIRNALKDGNLCPQFNLQSNEPVGDEDCLILNIYTPSIRGSRAVMVFLHGGAFVTGGGVSYFFGPKLLLEQDIVLVTVQYRLGALGFLSSGDNRAPGNWALLDQVAALRWIKDHISAFGGETNSVTLFGQDSGAVSATLLGMSPVADGLFSRIIALSGNALCGEYIQHKPREATLELARRVECSEMGMKEMVDCLRKVPVEDIILKSTDMHMFYSFPRRFTPVVDGVVILVDPEDMLTKGSFHRVPTLTGQTKDEGAFFYRLTLNTLSNGRYDDSFVDQLPRLLPMMSGFDRKLPSLSKAIRRKYFRNVDLDEEDQFRPKYVEFLTDLLYTRCTDRYSRLLANHSVPIYRYVFEYRGQYSVVNLQGEIADFGVAQGDDLQYIFSDLWGKDLLMSSDDIEFSKHVFVPLLTNFAKTGVPTSIITDHIPTSWTPFNKNRLFLRIGTTLVVDSDYRADASRFWNEEISVILHPTDKKNDTIVSNANIEKDEL
ncbi:carboxylesterase 4A-like [Daphnia carinata]|uniref:carboxylesterase 4A-like n=1 Tax=Daphnia carinata TaxID=120202 RepID=UPI0025807D76|nr:carboxylesterase 4A-like [Daphnia carinata]